MGEVILFPQRRLEDRMRDLVAAFDKHTNSQFVPGTEAHDRMMRDHYRALLLQERA